MTLAADARAVRAVQAALRSGPIRRATMTAQANALEPVAADLEAQPAPAPPPIPVQRRGAVWEYLSGAWTVDDAIAKLRALGCTLQRGDALWAQMEATKGVLAAWALTRLDEVIAKGEANGIQTILTLSTCPPWANGGQGWWTPPTNPADYAAFARSLFARYGTRVLYEVWNEPTLGWAWQPAPNLPAYVALVRATRAAIPNAYLLAGSLSSTKVSWLQAMYDAGLGGQFDALSLHPYTYNLAGGGRADPDTTFADMSYGLGVPLIRAEMDKRGDGARPIYVTELGWPAPVGNTEAEQAQYLARCFALAKAWPSVAGLCVYTLRDHAPSPTNPEDCYGLYRSDNTPKLAVQALQQIPA